jgi:hypothetical protein
MDDRDYRKSSKRSSGSYSSGEYTQWSGLEDVAIAAQKSAPIPIPALSNPQFNRQERPLARAMTLSNSQSPRIYNGTPILDDYNGLLSLTPDPISHKQQVERNKQISPPPYASEAEQRAMLDELARWQFEVREAPSIFSGEPNPHSYKIIKNEFSEELAKIALEVLTLVHTILQHPGNRRVLKKHMGDGPFVRDLFTLLDRGTLKALFRPLAKVIQSPISPEIAEIVSGRKIRFDDIINQTELDEESKEKLLHAAENYWRGGDIHLVEIAFANVLYHRQMNQEACKRIICAKQILFEKNSGAAVAGMNQNLDVIRKAVEIAHIKLTQLFDDAYRYNAPIDALPKMVRPLTRGFDLGTLGALIHEALQHISATKSLPENKEKTIDKALLACFISPDELSRFAGNDLFNLLMPAGINLIEILLKRVSVKLIASANFSHTLESVMTKAYEVLKRMFKVRNEAPENKFTLKMLKLLADPLDPFRLHRRVPPHADGVENPRKNDQDFFLHDLLPKIKKLIGEDSLGLIFIRHHLSPLEKVLNGSFLVEGLERKIEKLAANAWADWLHELTDPITLNKKIIKIVENGFIKKRQETINTTSELDWFERYSTYTGKKEEIAPESDPTYFKRASLAIYKVPDLWMDVGYGVNSRLGESLTQLLHLLQFPPFFKNVIFHLLEGLFDSFEGIRSQNRTAEIEFKFLNTLIYPEKLPRPEEPFSPRAMESILQLIHLLLNQGLSASSKKGMLKKSINAVAGGVLNHTSVVDNTIREKLANGFGQYGQVDYMQLIAGVINLIAKK